MAVLRLCCMLSSFSLACCIADAGEPGTCATAGVADAGESVTCARPESATVAGGVLLQKQGTSKEGVITRGERFQEDTSFAESKSSTPVVRRDGRHPIRGSALHFRCSPDFPQMSPPPPEAKGKALVVVIASLRAGGLTWPSFNHRVLQNGSVDLALAIGTYASGDPGGYRENAKFVWEVPDPADNNSTSLWTDVASACREPGDAPFNIETLTQNLGITFQGIGEVLSPPTANLFFYRWLVVQQVLENRLWEKYDRVVITRSDHVYLMEHNPGEVDFSQSPLFVAEGQEKDGTDWSGWTDRHWIVDMNKLAPALNMLEEVVRGKCCNDLIPKHIFNPETFLFQYYKRAGLDVTWIHRPMAVFCCLDLSLKQHGTCHSSFEGGLGDELGFLKPYGVGVKYPLEWKKAEKRCLEGPHPECCCQSEEACMSEECSVVPKEGCKTAELLETEWHYS